MQPDPLAASLRTEARDAPESGIVEVFNYGRTREGLIPLWVGTVLGMLTGKANLCSLQ